MALRTVGVRLTADISDYTSKLKQAAQTAGDFGGKLNEASKAGKLDKVADQATKVGLGLTGMAAYAIKSAADFDKAMSGVAVGVQDAKGHMGELRAAAIEAGKDTQYSATEAADGITELGKAGVSSADILNGGLKGALSLAAAGQLQVGDAAEIAASAMTDFKLSGNQIPHVADLLAAGAGKAQGSVKDIGMALSQSGLVAAQFGLSIEDTTGALAEFANAGLIGSDAGTSLKTMLLALANPSTQTRNEMAALGISFYDAQGKFIGLSGVAQVLQTRLKDLTVEQRNQALGQIFGNDAIRSASILYTDGAKGVEDWKNKVNDAGYAAETAQKQTDNLSGDLERLKGSLETIAIQGGSGANGGLRLLVQAVNSMVNSFANLPSGVGETLTVMAGLTGVVTLGGLAWLKYRKAVAEAKVELIAMGPSGEKAATGIGMISSFLGKASIALAAWQIAMVAADAIANKIPANVDAMTDGLTKFGQGAGLSGESARVLGQNLDNLKTGFAFLANTNNGRDQWTVRLQSGLESAVPYLRDYNTSLTNTKDQITALDTALTQMVSSGHTADAQAAFQRLASQLAVNGVSMDEFKKQFPGYEAALEASKGATQGAASSLGNVGSALQEGASDQSAYRTEAQLTAAAARGERDALVDLAKTIKGQTDPVFDLMNAEDALTTAQKAASKAVKEHGANSTEAKTATRQLAEAAIDLQGKVGVLGQDFDGKLTPAMRATFKAAGLTDAQINVLAKQFRDAKGDADKFAGKYAADASAPGAVTAKKQLEDARAAAKAFAGPWAAEVTVDGLNKVQTAFRKLSAEQQALKSGKTIDRLGGFAEGGWTGPGSKYQVAGVVHADEYVINKNSRQTIESKAPGLLDSMNATGKVPGYADGGRVWPYPVTAAMTKIPTEMQALSKMLGSAGGGSLGAWIMEGIKLAGVPASWAGPLRTLIMRESGGNPRAINLWDSNALAGHPSQGLMQTIPSTFEHYRLRSLPDEIMNPVANIVAGLRYIESRYGSIFNVQQANKNLPPKGYANGGWITEPVVGVGASGRSYTFAEHRPEYVDNRVTPAWQTGAQTGGGDVHIHATFSGPVGSRVELENWFTGVYSNLKKRGRV